MTNGAGTATEPEKVRVAGKGKSRAYAFEQGQTVAWWIKKAGKILEGGEKLFIGQEEVGPDRIVTSAVTITIGTEAANGA